MSLRTRLLRVLLVVLGVAVLVIGSLLVMARPAPEHPFFARFSNYPLVIAHADDTGNGLWPGNTMLMLEGVAELGVDVLEMDLHMSRDEVIVLMHDDSVDRTTNGTGKVSELSLAELQALDVGVNWSQDQGQSFPYRDAGLRIPTLAEVFERFPDYPMVIEIKQTEPPMGRQLCALIRQYGMQEQVIVPSFSDSAINEFRQACPEVATASSQAEVTALVLLNFAWLADTVTPRYFALQVPTSSSGIPVVTPGFVEAAKRRNLQVHVWTINDREQMQQLIDMGVHGIMTDRPDILFELLGR